MLVLVSFLCRSIGHQWPAAGARSRRRTSAAAAGQARAALGGQPSEQRAEAHAPACGARARAHSASGQRGQRSGGAALERLLPRTRARPGGPARGRVAQQAWQAGSGSGQRWAVAAGLQQATREQPSAPCRQGRPFASAGVELLAS